jgi:membrane-bound lytic murein transglycosylase MltF
MEKYLKPALITVAIVALFSLGYTIFKDRSTRDIDKIMDSGRLRVITDNSTLGFKIDKDSVYGFQYELIKAFAAKLGVELEIAENDDLRECVDELLNGEYDIVAAFVPVTTEYKDKVLFTNPIQVDRQMLVQRKGDSTSIVTKQYELANDTIFLPKNSPYKILINNLSNQIADTIYVSELKNTIAEVAVKMVADGIITYTICPERCAKKMLELYPNLDISIPIGFQQSSSWVITKNAPQLQQRLNEFLFEFVGSSEYWEIYRKYF